MLLKLNFIITTLVIINNVLKCLAEDNTLINPNAAVPASPDNYNQFNTESVLKFIQPETNLNYTHFENVKIMKTAGSHIFLLNELNVYCLKITSDQKSLELFGQLEDIDEEIVDSQAIIWNQYVMFVVALQSHYNIYVSKIVSSSSAASENSLMIPIEKLGMHGENKKLLLFNLKNTIYCLIGNVFLNEKESSMLRIYKWRKSHFTFIDEIRIDNQIDDIVLFDSGPETLILVIQNGNKHKQTLIQVHKIINGNRLSHVQNLYLKSNHNYPFTLNSEYYLLAQLKDATVTYLWRNDHFVKNNNHDNLKNVKRIAFGEDVVIVQQKDKISAFTNSKLSSAYDLEVNSSIDAVKTIEIVSDNNQIYVILFSMLNPNLFNIKMIEVQVEVILGSADQNENEAPKNCHTKLQNYLKNHKNMVERLENMIPNVIQKSSYLNFESKIKFNAANIVAKNATIEKINVNVDAKFSPIGLMQEIVRIQLRIKSFKNESDKATIRKKREDAKHVKVKTVNVKHLRLNEDLFKEFIIKSNETHLNGKIKTTKLIADKLNYKSIGQSPLLAPSPVESKKINKLQVKQINGIDWDEFISKLFRKSNPQPIVGNLLIRKSSTIRNMKTDEINELPIDNFMTTNTDQIIESDIFISQFHANTIEVSGAINGIKLSSEVALVNTDNLIETPVKILKCNIGNLTLAENQDALNRHVIGTRLEDLTQIYNGKVLIRGSLKLHNVLLERPKTALIIGGQNLNLNIASNYWMRSVDQKFDRITFTSLIQTPQITTDYLNAFPIDDYLLIDENPTGKVNLVFEKVYVRGNVYTDPEYKTTLESINENCVRRFGETTITGLKTFTGNLTVDRMVTGEIIDFPIGGKFVRKDELAEALKLDCTKTFQQLTIRGDLGSIGGNIQIVNLNRINLNEYFKNVVRIDENATIEAIVFENVKLNQAKVGLINSKLFNEIAEQLQRSVGPNGNVQSVRIRGDALFSQELNVNRVNDIILDEYLALVVSSQSGGLIGGFTTFSAGLNIGKLQAKHIDNIEISDWYAKALHRHNDQIIDMPWSLDWFDAVNINATTINSVATNQLIDAGVELIEINSDITIDSVEIVGNLWGNMFGCEIEDLIQSIKNGPFKKTWSFVEIDGHAEWPDAQLTAINQILLLAVTDFNQDIYGDVYFANEIRIDRVLSSNLINNINLLELHHDSLTYLGEHQSVSGQKHFLQPIITKNLISDSNIQTRFINTIDIIALNNSIFRLNENNAISGIKTFLQPPMIYKLNVYGSLYGIDFSDLAFVNNIRKLPPITFFKLVTVTENILLTDTINLMQFQYFIKERVRKTGPPQEITGIITFENLVIMGDTRIPSINGIKLDELVFSTSDGIQEIIGNKKIVGDLYLDGPAIIINLNGLDVVDAYTNSIFIDQNMSLKRLEFANELRLREGLVVAKQLNDVEIQSIIAWTPPSTTDLQPTWSAVQTTIEIVRKNFYLNKNLNSKLLYLDYAANIKIKYERYGRVSFIIDTVHSGEQCHLDHLCDCPAQYDISLALPSQIYIYRRPYFERIINIIGDHCNVTVFTTFITSCIPQNVTYATTIEWQSSTTKHKFVIPEPIVDIQLFEPAQSTLLLLINHINGTISVSKLQTDYWQRISSIGGFNTHLSVLSWESYRILVVFTKTITNSNHDQANIYYFSGQQFVELQIIPGDYSLCQAIYENKMFMMFLSKVGSESITVFRADYDEKYFRKFDLFQRIKLVESSRVKQMVPFLVDDTHYMSVITTDGYLYVYKYNYIEGWITITHGFFKNIEKIVPFNYYNKLYLIVSMQDSATALSVVHQGNNF